MKNMKLAACVLACTLLTACGQTSAETVQQSKSADTTVPAVSDDAEYVYNVASVSKVYVTAAVMQLVEAGEVELDAPITEYLPAFKMADPRYKDITVRMLMDHTSGIMGSSFVNESLYDDNDTDRHDHLLDYLSKQRLKADPGKYAAYCNDGFGLLELITESVSGMSYTDYVKQNISGRLGAKTTGTSIDMFRRDDLVPSVTTNNQRMESCYCCAIGDGGIYTTAADTALFGTAFFKGNHTLLSERSKNQMATRWDSNPYHDGNGLGWDYVDIPQYKTQGIQVVGKGGDAGADSDSDHAHLLVAPEQQISVAVLSNGGDSAMDALVAQALLNVALEEKGITVSDAEYPAPEIVAEIPQAYDRFAGIYYMNSSMNGASALCTVTFPEHRYLHMERRDFRKTTCVDYVLTSDGDFAELAYEVEESGFDKRLAGSHARISFEENADGVYIKSSSSSVCPGLGSLETKEYCGERLEDNNVGDDVLAAYQALQGKEFLLCSDKYSSSGYSDGIVQMYLTEKLKGYVFVVRANVGRLEKITDRTLLTAPMTIPSSANRDILDIEIVQDQNGVTGLTLSSGTRYMAADNIPAFDANVKTVTITENAAWYNISDSFANSSVTVTRPEHSAVYVYNKFGEVIYTTHNKDAKPQIPCPRGGKILFLGQSGDSFSIVG